MNSSRQQALSNSEVSIIGLIVTGLGLAIVSLLALNPSHPCESVSQ